MTAVWDFVVNLARAGHSANSILENVQKAFGPNFMGKTQVYKILAAVTDNKEMADQRAGNAVKTVQTAEVIEAMRVFVEEGRRVTFTDIQDAFGLSAGTVNALLKEDLGLVKKSARWVPRLLSDDQKATRAEFSRDFCRHAPADAMFLDRVITLDELAVSFHTPETKEQSKQRLPKGTPGPINARVHASRKKQMVMAFFNKQGSIYVHHVSFGSKVNVDYIVEVMGNFLKVLKRIRPELVENGWILHWDNAPVHTAKKTLEFLDAKGIQMLGHPPYSPDLATADFWLFPTIKSALAGETIDGNTVQIAWEWVTGGLPTEAFAKAYEKWLDRHNKCVRIEGDNVEKS